MNDRLLKQKLESIIHYGNEIEKAKEVVRTLESVRDDIVKQLAEFCPFEPDDLILSPSGVIHRFVKVKQAYLNHLGPGLELITLSAGNYSNGHLTVQTTIDFEFKCASLWKVLTQKVIS